MGIFRIVMSPGTDLNFGHLRAGKAEAQIQYHLYFTVDRGFRNSLHGCAKTS
jgi:hypothetical protein